MAESHIAGHATHSLRRRDRASDTHVERALTLHRDPELLRETLSRAKIPKGAERVAISLAVRDAPRSLGIAPGPYVVVTREGRFVTCLGEDMTPSGLFVVDRERMDVAIASVERMRERVAAAERLEADERIGQRLYRKLQVCGPSCLAKTSRPSPGSSRSWGAISSWGCST